MRRNWRANRILFLSICLFICSSTIVASAAGFLGPFEAVVSIPLNAIANGFNDVTRGLDQTVADLRDIQELRSRNAELEEALAQFQTELVELREIASDYQRLAELVDYTSSIQNQETLTAEVINYDPNGLLRTIVINKGARNGIAVGMPVILNRNLIGRIIDVTATASRVLLVTDPSSYVSARLQTTRAQGSVVGQAAGNLRMIMIPLDAEVQVGDVVITSGLGGNFPPDIVIGQITSKRQFEFEINQQAEIRSLVNFDSLEFVMVITSFQPVDLSEFEEDEE